MSRLCLPAPAKLNLFLHVVGRRDDGMHRLQTVFQLLDHGDTLWIEDTADTQIALACDLPGVSPEQNLVVRAARLLAQHAELHVAEPFAPLGFSAGDGEALRLHRRAAARRQHGQRCAKA